MFFETKACSHENREAPSLKLSRSLAIRIFLVLLSFAAMGSWGCATRRHVTSRVKPAALAPTIPAPRININTASAKDLETLPSIGKGLAARIVEHREKNGSFRLPEHLIMVRGISDRRFRILQDLITVD